MRQKIVNKSVNKLRRKRSPWVINRLFTDYSQLANRLINNRELLDFLFGWFAVGRLAARSPQADISALMRGNKASPMKFWCSTAYLSGFVGRDWNATLSLLLSAPVPGKADKPVENSQAGKKSLRK
jgi:hypothetical protein